MEWENDYEDLGLDQTQEETGSASDDTLDEYEPFEEGSADVDATEKSFIERYLGDNGIDKSQVTVYDENGEATEVDFDALSEDQKYDILKSLGDRSDDLLSDDEIAAINYLRQNNMSLSDFAQWQNQLGAQSMQQETVPQNTIDTYNDEEIIAVDMIRRFGDNISNEEIQEEIDRLKENPETFAKRADMLRANYQAEENAYNQMLIEDENQKMEQARGQFMQDYVNVARNMNYIQGVTLEDDDKNELLNFVLTKDDAGHTAFQKAMDDPENVLKMSWYLLHGDEIYDTTVDYFKKLISDRNNNNNKPRTVNRSRKPSEDVFSI